MCSIKQGLGIGFVGGNKSLNIKQRIDAFPSISDFHYEALTSLFTFLPVKSLCRRRLIKGGPYFKRLYGHTLKTSLPLWKYSSVTIDFNDQRRNTSLVGVSYLFINILLKRKQCGLLW